MNIEPIAFFRSPLTSKFGVPRQSGIVCELRGRIEFVPRYKNAEALRGLEEYDYLWLVWGFSENVDAQKHPRFAQTLSKLSCYPRAKQRT